MKIAIIFIGLIVQVNQPMSFDNTAVLIGAPLHQPKLIIPLQSIVNLDDPWLKQQPKVGPNVEIDISGADVRVKETRGIFSRLHSDFLKGSPALHALAPTCKLRKEVRKREIIPNVLAAYIDFRGGEVMPERYLRKKLSFTGKEEDAECAVCQVRYQATLRGDHVTLVYQKRTKQADGKLKVVEQHEIVVAGEHTGTSGGIPTIIVSNKPLSGTAPHSKMAFNIYTGNCCPVKPLISTQKCFGHKLCGVNATNTSEDDSTTPADPGDDCTIDRHP